MKSFTDAFLFLGGILKMTWFYLVLAGIFEVVWATTMKLSEGFSVLTYGIATAVGDDYELCIFIIGD